MSRCSEKGCVNVAPQGEQFCIYHKPKAASQPKQAPADDIQIVEVSSVPSRKSNEIAVKILAMLKALGASRALKVPLIKFPKPSLYATERYARLEGLRIRVRIVGDFGYLWKMSEAEIKAADEKGARMRSGIARKKKKAAAA